MSVTSEEKHVDSETVEVRGPDGGGLRGPLNWFGSMFGVVVLVGVGLLFLLTDGSDRSVEDVDAVDVPTEPVPVETPAEAVETPSEPVVEAPVGAVETPSEPVVEAPVGAVETPVEAVEADHVGDAPTEPAVETPVEAVEADHVGDAPTEPVVETPVEAVEADHVDEAPAAMVDAAGTTVIEIEMVDYAYTPDTVDIQAGVPVVFRFTNTGNFEHEAMIGDMHQQEEFAAEGDHDTDDGHHGDVMAVVVQPGQTADLEVLIDEPGTSYMACHIPGHYERGQIATINVAA